MKKDFTLAGSATHVVILPVMHRRSWVDVINVKIGSILPTFLNLLYALRVSLKVLTHLPLNLFAIRTRFTLSVRKFAPAEEGFTLAEVLITLGIIGVVAAITIPGLVNKCKRIILKNQFKKNVALVNQIIRRTKANTDIETFAEYCTVYNGSKYINANNCIEKLLENHTLKSYKPLSSVEGFYNVDRNNDVIKTYNGEQKAAFSDFGNHGLQHALYYTIAMADGQYINYWVENAEMYVPVDINGSAKPNRLGHDIFIFTINKKDDSLTGVTAHLNGNKPDDPDNWINQVSGAPCNLTSTQKGNGIGCAVYALKDKCPYNNTQGYFECLPK